MRLIAITAMMLLPVAAEAATSFTYEKAPVQPTKVSNLPLTAFGDLSVASRHSEISMMFPYGYEDHVATLAFTGNGSTASVNGVFAVRTAAQANSSAALCSRAALRYRPGMGAKCIHTNDWTTGVAASTQIAGCFSKDFKDGYGFGWNGGSFGAAVSSGGYMTWIPTSSWNIDKMDGTGPSGGTLALTRGQIFSEQYQWLGYGAITYFVSGLGTTELWPVHRIAYAGTQDMTSTQNPSLSMCVKAQNHANTSQLTITAPSYGAFIEGVSGDGAVKHASSTVQASVGTTPYPVITIRSTNTYRGLDNRIGIRISGISISNESVNRNVEIKLRFNVTSLTGASFTQYGGTNHSPIDIDDSATAFTGGDLKKSWFVGKSSALHIDLRDEDLFVEPGETATASAVYDTGSGDVKISIEWEEEY